MTVQGLVLAAVLWGVAPLSSGASSTQDSAGQQGAEPTQTRLTYLRQLLDSESHAGKVWTWSWVGAYGAVTVGQVAAIPFVADRGTRIDLWVGSVSSLLGALGLGLAQLNLPSSKDLPADPEAALLEAQRRLHLAAEQERAGTAWYVHAANVGVNVAIGLVLGLVYGRWESGALSFGIGFVAGEITLLTQPTRLIEVDRAWSAGVIPSVESVKVRPEAHLQGRGMSISFNW